MGSPVVSSSFSVTPWTAGAGVGIVVAVAAAALYVPPVVLAVVGVALLAFSALAYFWSLHQQRANAPASTDVLTHRVAFNAWDSKEFSGNLCVDRTLVPIQITYRNVGHEDGRSVRVSGFDVATVPRGRDSLVSLEILADARDWLKIQLGTTEPLLFYRNYRLLCEARAEGTVPLQCAIQWRPKSRTKKQIVELIQQAFLAPSELLSQKFFREMTFCVYDPMQGVALGIDFAKKRTIFFSGDPKFSLREDLRVATWTGNGNSYTVECGYTTNPNCSFTYYSLTLTKTRGTALSVLLNGVPAERFACSPLLALYSPQNIFSREVLSGVPSLDDKNLWNIISEYAGFFSKFLPEDLIASKLENGEMQTWVDAGCPLPQPIAATTAAAAAAP